MNLLNILKIPIDEFEHLKIKDNEKICPKVKYSIEKFIILNAMYKNILAVTKLRTDKINSLTKQNV